MMKIIVFLMRYLQNTGQQNYVIIANRTSEHFATLHALEAVGFKGIVMVEKPLFSKPENFDPSAFEKVIIGYNLRFHPLMKRLRQLLSKEKIHSAQIYVGQDLRQWRPGTDYRSGYSAIRDQGGGVLRDLSHELDYLCWLLGPWKEVAAISGTFSDLEIETEDVVGLLLRTECCPAVQVQLNYLDKVGRREMLFNGASVTIKADLFNGRLDINETREDYVVERDLTYQEEHRAVLNGAWTKLCSYQEGFQTLRLIESVEKAAGEKVWVKQ